MISGATGSSYTLVVGDRGKTIKARVSFTDDAGYVETLTSAATDVVVAVALANSGGVETAVISNAGKPHNSAYAVTENTGEFSVAQRFCTGSKPAMLTKVRIFANDPDNNVAMSPRVALHAGGSASAPGGHLVTLTNPLSYDSSYSTGDDFTTTGYQLEANTYYWVKVRNPGTNPFDFFLVSNTASKKADASSATGWSLGRSTLMSGHKLRMAVFADTEALTHFPAQYAGGCGEPKPKFQLRVEEHSPQDTVVGSVAAINHDDDTLTYSVSNGRYGVFDVTPLQTSAAEFNKAFTINSQGQVLVKEGADLDFEESQIPYVVKVSVTDGEDESGNTQTTPTTDDSTYLMVTVGNIDEPGVITFSPADPTTGYYQKVELTDPDRVFANPKAGLNARITWQWSRGDSADGAFTDIPGATVSDYRPLHGYMPQVADAGKFLRATVTYVDKHNPGKTAQATTGSAVALVDPKATFSDAPASHDGATEFDVTLSLNGHPDGWTNKNVNGNVFGAMEATGGRLARLRPSDGSIIWEGGKSPPSWIISVVPAQSGDITVRVPIRACDQANAVCILDRPLAAVATLTVPGPDGVVSGQGSQENSAATGTPTISGTAQVGQTLTVSTSGIADADGLTNATYTYQWIRVDTDATETNISGATGSTYTLVAGDLGKAIKVTGVVHRRRGQRGKSHQLRYIGGGPRDRAANVVQQFRHRVAGHQRHGAGGADADGVHVGHRRRRRADQRDVHLRVAGRRLAGGLRGDQRRHGFHLHAGGR